MSRRELLATILLPVLLVLVQVEAETTLTSDVLPEQDSSINKCDGSSVVAYPGPILPKLKKHVELWQCVVLILCFGAFALFITLIHRIIRQYIYFDAHLLDTFFDGGGDVNMGLVACSLVAKWTWTFSFTWSVADVRRFGLVGHFWMAAGMAIQLFLFAVVAAEIRIKAPGAKTFLQVLYARYGPVPHVIVMIFALIVNIMVAGMVMTEGTYLLTALTDGLSKEVVCILLVVAIGFYTVVGGVGGAIYVTYFASALIMAIVLVFLTDVFWDPLQRANQTLGNWEKVWDRVKCYRADASNEESSAVTFIARDGMIEGVLLVLASFGIVFSNQSFWQSGIAAKPGHAVWGFITGGMAWFTVPFGFSYAFGMAYMALSVDANQHLVNNEDSMYGYLVLYMGQKLMDRAGTFMIFVIILVAVVTTGSGEVLSASSIIIYDLYQTYVSPFQKPRARPNATVREQRNQYNEEYLEYDRRCVVLKHVIVITVTCVLIPVCLILMAIDIDIWWLFMFTGVLTCGCVMPVVLAITWHRITGTGVTCGVLAGFAGGLIAWLVTASTKHDGLNIFRDNTARELPLLLGLAIPLGLAGVVCISVSLLCGGCDRDRREDEEWERTRQIDNPVLPWNVKYAPDLAKRQGGLMGSRPHFYVVRRSFKGSEICAYILGVLLAVCTVLVWPALMLTANVFSKTVFEAWTLAVLILTAIAAGYIVLVPLIFEMVAICRQAYFNRLWKRHGAERFEDEPEPRAEPVHVVAAPMESRRSSQPSVSDFDGESSGWGPGPESEIDDPNKRERWKTFIHLGPN